MTSRTDTRQLLLESAAQLFVQQGYTGFSYQDLSERHQLKKASIHYHFPAKEDLGREVLQHYHQQFCSWSQRLLDLPVVEQFPAYITFFKNLLNDGAICPCGMASSEYRLLPARMTEVLETFYKDQLNVLTQLLKNAQTAGLIALQHVPTEQALVLGCTLQGALQYARVQQNPTLFEEIMQTSWKNLKSCF